MFQSIINDIGLLKYALGESTVWSTSVTTRAIKYDTQNKPIRKKKLK